MTYTSIFNRLFLGAVVVALAFLFWQHHTLVELRDENAALLQSNPQSDSTSSNSLVSSPASTATTPSQTASDNQLAELERLRTETGDRSNEIKKLRGELAALADADAARNLPFSFRFEKLPKSSWANSGYATPETALQTMLWASRDGDVAALRASLTTAEQQRRAQGEWKGKTDDEIADLMRQRLANATGVQILKYEILGADTMHFTVFVEGYSQADQPVWMDINRVGNEWRANSTEHHR